MKFFELNLNGKTLKFRLRSEDCIAIEEKTKCKMLDYIRNYSHTAIITILRYLRKSDVPNFSQSDACNLLDELIDNGYTLEKVVYDVIYEALVVSGFLEKEELEEMKQDIRETTKKMKKKEQDILEKQ